MVNIRDERTNVAMTKTTTATNDDGDDDGDDDDDDDDGMILDECARIGMGSDLVLYTWKEGHLAQSVQDTKSAEQDRSLARSLARWSAYEMLSFQPAHLLPFESK